ncbi:glucose dehydrogenase [FAD, quinone]-like [Cloeon dipterum]|uniref:glucose dehydrogenase [FAD, quinone]-like n=1 Tax=Cloeon dipterum TaxID=197152 RepID=UPI00321FB613
MNFLPFRLLIFIYTIAVCFFQLYCRFCNWSERFLSPECDDNLFFDFIVVGGGSAGAVVASRLSEDKGHSVLLLEAGGSPSSLFDTPSVAPMLQKTDYDWQFVTEPQKNSCLALNNNASVWPRGKILGGCGRLNFMMHVRGDPRDFDSWAATGNQGWSYEQVVPFFKKSETHPNHKSRFRGRNGPIHVDYLSWTSPLVELFLKGGQALGYAVGDLNGDLTEGFSVTQVNVAHGKRLSTDSVFLKKKMNNLKVLTFSHVEKVLFHGLRAIGVKFSHKGKTKFAYSTKDVILSAGAVGSPQILMLSGVGATDHLKQHKIDVIRDLPGVGLNLQDHVTTGANNVLLEGKSAAMGLNLATMLSPFTAWQYFWSKSGPVSSNGCEAYAMVYSSEKINRSSSPPDVQLLFFPTGHSFEGGTVLKDITGTRTEVWQSYFAPFEEKSVASIFAVLLRPKSRGSIRLKSSNPYEHPVINPNYFNHPDDIETIVRGLQFVQKLVESDPFKSNGASFNPFPLTQCKLHEFASFEYWECYVRHMTGTVYHPCGTCKMGPSADSQAVVDDKLRVHGIRGLRVIDASIMPTIVGANINAATIMIAEKGAQLIKDYWSNRAISSTYRDFFVWNLKKN